MVPQDRWGLGLGLLVIVGLLYVACSFVVKRIEGSGVSPFLLTYLCTCLFVFHLPFRALLKSCQACFQKAPSELLDGNEGGPFQQKQELISGAAKKKDVHIETARRDHCEGDWKGTSLLTKHESPRRKRDQESKSDGGASWVPAAETEGQLLLEPEGSSDELSSQGASCPQTPADSILDAWKAPNASLKPEAFDEKEDLQTAGANEPHDVSAVLLKKAQELKRKDSDVNQEAHDEGINSSVSGSTRGSRPGLGKSESHELTALDSQPLEAGPHDVLSGFSSAEQDSGSSAHSGPLGFLLCSEHLEAVRVALAVGPLWFLAQYAYTLSLTLTSVTSNTILFTCTSLFTFLISVVWLKERFTLIKLAAILCAMVGTALVSISDAQSAPEGHASSSTTAGGATLGNLVTLVSALVYAFYGTTVKHMLPLEVDTRDHLPLSRAAPRLSVSTSLVFGYIGLLGGILLLPWLVVLGMAGTEGVQWMGGNTLGLIVVKGIVGNVVADYLCSRAISLTTPTLASVGMAFQAPIAILADFVIYGAVPTTLMLFGALLVVGGFFGIDLDVSGQKP